MPLKLKKEKDLLRTEEHLVMIIFVTEFKIRLEDNVKKCTIGLQQRKGETIRVLIWELQHPLHSVTEKENRENIMGKRQRNNTRKISQT